MLNKIFEFNISKFTLANTKESVCIDWQGISTLSPSTAVVSINNLVNVGNTEKKV